MNTSAGHGQVGFGHKAQDGCIWARCALIACSAKDSVCWMLVGFFVFHKGWTQLVPNLRAVLELSVFVFKARCKNQHQNLDTLSSSCILPWIDEEVLGSALIRDSTQCLQMQIFLTLSRTTSSGIQHGYPCTKDQWADLPGLGVVFTSLYLPSFYHPSWDANMLHVWVHLHKWCPTLSVVSLLWVAYALIFSLILERREFSCMEK